MRIVYRMASGRASDVRFAPDGYVLGADERELEANELPDVETLHDASFVAAERAEREAQRRQDELRTIDQRALRALRELMLDSLGAKPLAPTVRAAAIARLRVEDDAADVVRAQLPHAPAV